MTNKLNLNLHNTLKQGTVNFNEIFRTIQNNFLSSELDLTVISHAAECSHKANEIAYEFIANIDAATEAEALPIYTHINLLGRIFEQIEGMLTCIVTRNFTSAEAIARVVVEGSINLTYIAKEGDVRTITAFMARWLTEHLRKLNEWKKEVEGKEYQDQITHLITERLESLKLYEIYVDRAKDIFEVPEKNINELWTSSIFKRFEKLEKTEDYFSIYHRLSGSSHMTAEDTISFMIAIQMPEDIRIKMTKEACAYSVMMSRIVCAHFIDCVYACCSYHGMTDNIKLKKLKELKEALHAAIEEIRIAAGVPMDKINI